MRRTAITVKWVILLCVTQYLHYREPKELEIGVGNCQSTACLYSLNKILQSRVGAIAMLLKLVSNPNYAVSIKDLQ